ncbi:MAG: hypothetical protein WC261_09085 [Synergistaceae bacterium]|jgi:hypothetical protein
MRTEGTFQDVYNAAQAFYTDDVEQEHRPLNPVVRREGKIWMLESALNPENEDCNFSCALDDFDSYWYEMYRETNHTITNGEIEDFIDVFSQNRLED